MQSMHFLDGYLPVHFGLRRALCAPGCGEITQQAAIEGPITAKRCPPFNSAHILEGARIFLNLFGDAMLAESLHSALIQVVCFRENGGRWVLFEEHMLDLLIRQEARQGETDSATTNDNNGDINRRSSHGDKGANETKVGKTETPDCGRSCKEAG
jgi:hypothetical protein